MVLFTLDSICFEFFFLELFDLLEGGGDYSDVPASKPDREGFIFLADASCAGATILSARGLFNLFIALSAG